MKNIFLYMSVLILPYLGFNVQPDEVSNNCAQIVALLGDQLAEHPDWLDIDHQEIKNFNLSDRKIGPVDFKGWQLVNIDFTNSDLTEVKLDEAKFEGVKLGGAILCKGLRLGQKISPFRLVKLYSKFVKNGSAKKVQALNNIIDLLPLDLTAKDLSGLDLTHINLKLAILNDANLRNTILVDAKLPSTINSRQITIENDYLDIVINSEPKPGDHNLIRFYNRCDRIMELMKGTIIFYGALLILSSPLIGHAPLTVYLIWPLPFLSLFIIYDCCHKT